MERFYALKFEPHPFVTHGVIARMDFPNGYTASVVQTLHSYGGDQGLYELAVMRDDEVVYDTSITSDVLGHLTPEEVDKVLGDIMSLKNLTNVRKL